VGEEAKRRIDRRRRMEWDHFAWSGDVTGLPGFAFGIPPALAVRLAIEADRAAEGRFEWLGTSWPAPDRPDWWNGRIWTLDPASGRAWPGAESPASKSAYRGAEGMGDVKLVWELNRLQYLPVLAAAGRDELVEAIVAAWMEANPPGRGVNWTNGIELASRVVSVLAAMALSRRGPSPEFMARVRAFLSAHAREIERYPSLFSSANNHRVAELAALFLIGLCAPGLPGAGRFGPAARKGLEGEIGRQFHADGVGAEQSPTYAAYSLEWFLICAVAAEASGAPFSERFRERVRAAASHLRWMLDEAGEAPAIGDDDEGRVLSLGQGREDRYVASVCALAGRWLQDGGVAPPRAPDALRDLLCARPAPVATEPFGLKTFPHGGYTVARRNGAGGVRLAVFDHAPLGFLSIAAHGHADALSVWLHWGDEPVLVDAGTYLYHAGGAERDRFRGTAVHNTLTLEGRDQSVIAGPFNWSEHAEARVVASGPDWVEAEHDGYRKAFGVAHRRRVSFGDDRLVVSDRLDGDFGRAPAWSAGFTFAPGTVLEPEDGGWIARTPGGRRLRVRVSGAGHAELTTGPFSPAFGTKLDAPRLLVSGEAAGSGSLAQTEFLFLG
jgi:hypothetical protein